MPILIRLNLVKLRELKVWNFLVLLESFYICRLSCDLLGLKDSNNVFFILRTFLDFSLPSHLLLLEDHKLLKVFVEVSWYSQVVHSWDLMKTIRISVLSDMINLNGFLVKLKQNFV